MSHVPPEGAELDPPPLPRSSDCLNAWSSAIVGLDLIDKFSLTGENKRALVAQAHINGKLAVWVNVRHN